MTDEEIIKRLEQCVKRGNRNYDTDIVLDLINRQQEDIERLHSMNCAKLDTIHDLQADTDKLKEQLQDVTEKFNCQQTVYTDLSKIIKDQKKEIAKVKYENEILSINADNAFQNGLNEAQDLYAEQVKAEIKAEAYKEFAEALKKRYDNPVWYLGGSNGFFDNLDSFVKEMAGAENDA